MLLLFGLNTTLQKSNLRMYMHVHTLITTYKCTCMYTNIVIVMSLFLCIIIAIMIFMHNIQLKDHVPYLFVQMPGLTKQMHPNRHGGFYHCKANNAKVHLITIGRGI